MKTETRNRTSYPSKESKDLTEALLAYIDANPEATYVDAANACGTVDTRARGLIRKARPGYESPYRNKLEERNNIIEEYALNNLDQTIHEVAEHFGMNRPNVAVILRKKGIRLKRKPPEARVHKEGTPVRTRAKLSFKQIEKIWAKANLNFGGGKRA